MTLGELASFFNTEAGIGARLKVVSMLGYRRGDWLDQTGQTWMNPSPNLRSLTQAVLCPSVALVEGADVSVGRGTDTPFELVGAPWIEDPRLAEYLKGRGIPGVSFEPVGFTPASRYPQGQALRGCPHQAGGSGRPGFPGPPH